MFLLFVGSGKKKKKYIYIKSFGGGVTRPALPVQFLGVA
jgi:hypothetical protein